MKTDVVKGNYVPPKRTRITSQEMTEALRKSLSDDWTVPDAHTLLVLVAMSAHETGEWMSCWNYNLGNVKASPTWGGNYTCLDNVWEVLKGKERWFSPRGEIAGRNGGLIGEEWSVPPGHPQTRFRAYQSLEYGVAGFAMKMSGMYRPALEVLCEGGTSDAFVAELKALKYFTGDLVKYQASVRRFYRDFSSGEHFRALDLGDAGPDVLAVTTRLAALTYLGETELTDTFTERVDAAVREFQRSRGLKVDGIVGTYTREALEPS